MRWRWLALLVLAGVAARRVAADVAQAAIEGDQDSPGCGGLSSDVLVRAPVRLSAETVSTSCPALARMAADEEGRSSSLNFTRTAGAGADPRGPAQHHKRRPRGRPWGSPTVLGGDLVGGHPGCQAVQDYADWHTSPGDHGLAVHQPRIGGDHLQLL